MDAGIVANVVNLYRLYTDKALDPEEEELRLALLASMDDFNDMRP